LERLQILCSWRRWIRSSRITNTTPVGGIHTEVNRGGIQNNEIMKKTMKKIDYSTP